MKLKSLPVRIVFAMVGILIGAIFGCVTAQVLLGFTTLEGVARTNGIVIATAIGAGVGYGALHTLRLRMLLAVDSQPETAEEHTWKVNTENETTRS